MVGSVERLEWDWNMKLQPSPSFSLNPAQLPSLDNRMWWKRNRRHRVHVCRAIVCRAHSHIFRMAAHSSYSRVTGKIVSWLYEMKVNNLCSLKNPKSKRILLPNEPKMPKFLTVYDSTGQGCQISCCAILCWQNAAQINATELTETVGLYPGYKTVHSGRTFFLCVMSPYGLASGHVIDNNINSREVNTNA